MKRLSLFLTPALMTGALLGICGISKAQSNMLSILGDVPFDLPVGDSFSLAVRATQNTPSAATTTVQHVLFLSDSRYFDVTWTRNPGLNPSTVVNEFSPKTTTIASGEYAGTHTMFSTTYGFQPARTLEPNTFVGTYTFTLRQEAPFGVVFFGLAQTNVAGNGVIESPDLSSTFRSFLTTSNPNLAATSLEGSNYSLLGRENRPGAYLFPRMPAPSSLAVFALGCLAPATMLFRRRHATK
jgi:hypothetical protein